MRQAGASIRTGSPAQQSNCLAGRIDHLIKCGNDWAEAHRLPDIENYVHGNIKFAFEGVKGGGYNFPKFCARREPPKVPGKFAVGHSYILEKDWTVWNCLIDFLARDFCVVRHRYQEFVFVSVIEFADEKQKLVPSLFTVGAELAKGAIEACPGSLGEHVGKGTLKSICFAGKRKLDAPPLLIVSAMRRDDFPIDVIEGGSEVVDDVTCDQRDGVFYGFVAFDKKGAVSGFRICLNNEGERSVFFEKFVKIANVYRGPINLQGCAVCHGKQISG